MYECYAQRASLVRVAITLWDLRTAVEHGRQANGQVLLLARRTLEHVVSCYIISVHMMSQCHATHFHLASNQREDVMSKPMIIVQALSVSLFQPNSVRRTDARWVPPTMLAAMLWSGRCVPSQ